MAKAPKFKLFKEKLEIPQTIIVSEVLLLPIVFTLMMLTLGVLMAVLSLVLIAAASFTAIYFYSYAAGALKTRLMRTAAEYGVPIAIEKVMTTFGNVAYAAILATPIGLYVALYFAHQLHLPLYTTTLIIGVMALAPALAIFLTHFSMSATVKFRASRIEEELPYFPVIARILDLALVPFEKILEFVERSWLKAIAFEISIAKKMAQFTGVTLPEAVYRRALRVHRKFADTLRVLLEEYETTGRITKTAELLSDIELKTLERQVTKIADSIDFISSIVTSTLGLIAATLFVLLIFVPMGLLRIVLVLGGIPVLLVTVISLPWYFMIPRILREYVPKGRAILAMLAGVPVALALYFNIGANLVNDLALMLAIVTSPAAAVVSLHMVNVKRAEAELPTILRRLAERVSLGEDPVRVLSELAERARSRYSKRALTVIARSAETGIFTPLGFASPLLSFAYETLEGILIGGYATGQGLDLLADTISKIIAFKQSVSVSRTTMLASVLITVFIVLVSFIVAGAVVEMIKVLGKVGMQTSVIALSAETIDAMKVSIAIMPLAVITSYGAANGSLLTSLPIFTLSEFMSYVVIMYQPMLTQMFLASIGGLET